MSWRSFVRSFVRSFICLVRCVALHCVALHCVVGIVVVGGGGDGYSFGVVVALCELVLCCCDSKHSVVDSIISLSRVGVQYASACCL